MVEQGMNLDKIDITKLTHDEKAQLYDQLIDLKVRIESDAIREGFTLIPQRSRIKKRTDYSSTSIWATSVSNMIELETIELAISPHLPKTFVRVYKDNIRKTLIITLADEKDMLFKLPDGTYQIMKETDTGEADPRDLNCLVTNRITEN